MIKYFVSFVICNQFGDSEAKTDVITAPLDTTHRQLLEMLWDGNWPEAQYVSKFEPWDKPIKLTAKQRYDNVKSAYKKFIETMKANGYRAEYTEEQFIDCLQHITKG